MSSHPALRDLAAAAPIGASSQAQSMPRRIIDGVISGGTTNLRVSLELVTQRPASRSYIIRNADEMMARITSTLSDRDEGMPTSELDWSPEKAKAIRQGLASWAEDWEDPALDAYNVYLQR